MVHYYLNVNPIDSYKEICSDENYVDKTGLIQFVNSKMKKPQKLILVSRPRRFGKTYAAQMLKAYYTIGYDTMKLFEDKEIFRIDPKLTHRGEFDVIYIDMLKVRAFAKDEQRKMDKQAATRKRRRAERLDWIDFLEDSIIQEVADEYGADVIADTLGDTLVNTVNKTGRQFVWICDEWDNFFREPTDDPNAKANYIELLRSLFRNKDTCATVFAAAYMTGILPMIKMKGYSTLVEFDNYTMFSPGDLASYIGFTEEEVKVLLRRNPGCQLTYDDLAGWYEGYVFPEIGPIFNPLSVIEAIEKDDCETYWDETGSNEEFRELVPIENDTLWNNVERLLRSEEIPVYHGAFDDDLNTLPAAGPRATLAALVHLGYLSYDQETECAKIPNEEIREMYLNLLENSSHPAINRKIVEADAILENTLKGEEQKVAEGFRKIHYDYANTKAGNSEATLKETIDLAYYTAERFYQRRYEVPSGEGYADMFLYPKAGKAMPLMVIELKKNEADDTGLDQIKARRFPDRFKDYGGRELLLVAVSYDADKLEKEHYCKIEKMQLPMF